MADNKNNIDMSNTMEINSILEETRTRRYEPKRPDAPRSSRHQKSGDISRAVTAAPGEQTYGRDDFVYVDEDGSAEADRKPESGGAPKSKKPLVITLIIVGALLVAGIVGFIIWKTSSPSAEPLPSGEIAESVMISGVDVGGMNAAQAKQALAAVENMLADSIRIEVASGDKKVVLTKDDLKYSFNTDDILRQVLTDGTSSTESAASGSRDPEIGIIIDESSYTTAAEKAASQLNTPAKDAKVTAYNPDRSDAFTYQKEQSGQKLKNDDLIKKLKALVDSGKLTGTIEAVCEETKPAITEDALKSGIKKLGSFTTESTNSWNGNENMRVSLGACNGSVIEPGATWSFNSCTGDSNLESNGYQPAGVIVQGRHEIGIGGGICQSSTTIYNAALLTGMEIVERECHYYPSSYVDYGRDATIDYGNIDLKLKNPFKYQLFLKCWMDGVILHAEIYGLQADDFDEVRISTSDPSYFSNGYTVTASRTFYKDGKVVRTEALPSSTYYFSAPGDDDDSSSSSKPASSSGSASSKPSSSDDPSSSEPGGDEPGGDEPGGDEPGGDEPGGDEPGGDEPGGDEPGGDQPGGDEPGDQPGGEGNGSGEGGE